MYDLEISPELDNEQFEEDNERAEEIDMAEPFDPSQIKINPKQDTLRNILDRLRHNEIDLNTDFQRHADLWDSGKMSRLIESILIRFPLPAFYFDATDDDCWLVVDGLQRLSSIRKFVVEQDPKIRLRLRNLEYLTNLNGKNYDEIGRNFQRRIDECPITYFQIMPGTPPEVKYSIFRRINTGGLTLNEQEIRNALAKPEQRNFLKRLAEDSNLILCVGDQSKRMKDQELVLRFLAFYFIDYLKSKKSIAPFLDEMQDNLAKLDSRALRDLEAAFRRAAERSFKLFGPTAFEKRPEGAQDPGRKRKNSTLFEVWMVELARLTAEQADQLIAHKKQVLSLHAKAMESNTEYYRAISLATQKREHVQIRYSKVREIIQEALNA